MAEDLEADIINSNMVVDSEAQGDLEDSMEVEGDSVDSMEDHSMVAADMEDTTEVAEGDLVEVLEAQVDIMAVEEEDSEDIKGEVEDIMEEEEVGLEDQVDGRISFDVAKYPGSFRSLSSGKNCEIKYSIKQAWFFWKLQNV